MLGLSFEGYNLLLQEEGKEAIQFSEFIAVCAGDIVYCLIFGALGIFWSYRTMTQDNNENNGTTDAVDTQPVDNTDEQPSAE